MTESGTDITIKYILLTSALVISAKFVMIMSKRLRTYMQESRFNKLNPILKKLYNNSNAYQISREYRRENKIDKEDYIYGEIIFSTFSKLLNIVQPRQGEIFYDLGCGSGKAVFTTALQYDYLDARGIEYLKPLYDLCVALQVEFRKLTDGKHPNNTQFINADFLSVDFSDANIIFMNATTYSRKSWEDLMRACEKLKKGARIIVTSKKVESKSFELIHSGFYLFSWGQSFVSIYQKIR